MTVVLPANYGAADWTDYTDYWREVDAEWIQARTILRVGNVNGLDSLPTPGVGQVAYVEEWGAAGGIKDLLWMYASDSLGDNSDVPGWVPYPALPRNMAASEDSTTRVTFGHHTGNPANVNPTVTLDQSGIKIVDNLDVQLGGTDIMTVRTDGIRIKVGSRTARLWTDTDEILLDTQLVVPGIRLTGGSINASGRTVTAATLSATTGNITTVNSTTVNASGNVSGTDLLFSSEVKNGTARFRSVSGDARIDRTDGTAYVEADKTYVRLGGRTYVYGDGSYGLFVYNGESRYYEDGTFRGRIPAVIRQSGTPPAAQYYEGCLWVKT